MENAMGGGKAAVMYKESDPKLIEAVRKLIAADPNRYTQRYIGAQVGALTKRGTFSGAYVSTWLSRGWTGEDFEPALQEWLAADAEERKRRRTEFWRRNPIADQIKLWLDFSMAEGKVIAITGDSGIGKTETIDHCLSDKRGVFRLQASPQRNSAKHIVATLRDIIGESHPAFASAYNTADGIVRYFLEFAHLIVVDDFDLLIESAYEFLLRDLWNQTRLGNKTTPQIWLGNEEGIQRIRRLSPQLKSRLRHVKLDLEDAFDTRFVREFMEHHLEDCELTPAMVKAGVVIANLPGSSHLRLVRDLCREVVWHVNRGDEAESVFFDAWENMDDYLAIKATAPRLLNGIGRAGLQSLPAAAGPISNAKSPRRSLEAVPA